ncbi:MAG: zf-HC2 domain-containing protein [Desulfobacteraceae bacterium]|jgi:hypothetical protein
MDCEDIKELIIEYIEGTLDNNNTRSVDEHLSSCKDCRAEFEIMRSMWLEFDNLEVRQLSGNVKKNIENMIDSYNLGINDNKRIKRHAVFSKWLESWWPKRPLAQFAITVIVVIISFVTGFGINSKTQSQKDILSLQKDMIQQVVMSSLLDQASVTERIRGLTMTSRLKNVDKEFYSTLLLMLNSDSNVNVRLAAVNALAHFTDNGYVRHELIKSLGLQSSPLVQVSLIDLLATIREPESYSTLINIMNDSGTNEHVKERAKEALNQFI